MYLAEDVKFIDAIASMTGIDPKEVSERLSELSLEDALDVVDAVSDVDRTRLMRIMPRQQKKSFDFAVGDEVEVEGDEGVVKEPDGPNNTVGILINGEMRMADRDTVTPVKESVRPLDIRSLMNILKY